MKTTITLFLLSVFSVSIATAQPMTANEIFASIDSEYNHIEDDNMRRVNYDLGKLSSNNLLDYVISAVDGEYSIEDKSRVNFSLDSGTLNDTRIMDEVLSGIDAEYSH